LLLFVNFFYFFFVIFGLFLYFLFFNSNFYNNKVFFYIFEYFFVYLKFFYLRYNLIFGLKKNWFVFIFVKFSFFFEKNFLNFKILENKNVTTLNNF